MYSFGINYLITLTIRISAHNITSIDVCVPNSRAVDFLFSVTSCDVHSHLAILSRDADVAIKKENIQC